MILGMLTLYAFWAAWLGLFAWNESRGTARRRTSEILLWGAAVWSAWLIYLAIALPVHTVDGSGTGLQPRHSLVRVYGYAVLWRAAVPLVVALAVTGLLHSRTRYRQVAEILGVFLSAVLLVAGIIGFVTFLIGILVVPTGLALLTACLCHRDERRARPLPPPPPAIPPRGPISAPTR